MSVKMQNTLIDILSRLLSVGGTVYILTSQYINSKVEVGLSVKIAIPTIIVVIFIFNLHYKSWQQGVERRLIAITTAQELGKAGTTKPVTAVFLDAFGIIVPMAMYATLFVIGGKFLQVTGIVLFECLAVYMIRLVGKVLMTINNNEELQAQEKQQAEEMAEKVADKVAGRMAVKLPEITKTEQK
jgi:3-deoxy-D-manno-octulosonic-acid transferase